MQQYFGCSTLDLKNLTLLLCLCFINIGAKRSSSPKLLSLLNYMVDKYIEMRVHGELSFLTNSLLISFSTHTHMHIDPY